MAAVTSTQLTQPALVGPEPPAGMLVHSRSHREPVPYLGPEPVPSRTFGVARQVLCAVLVAAYVVQGFMYLDLAREHEALADTVPFWTPVGDLVLEGPLLATLRLLTIPLVIVGIIAQVLWARARRPKEELRAYGEAGVEMPLGWVVPLWLRFFPVVCVVVGRLAFVSRIDQTTTVSDLAGLDRGLAVACFAWAFLWLSAMAWPARADAAQDLRSEWSAWYRERPGSVPYVEPVKGEDTEIGQPEGGLWVVTTAGLLIGLPFGALSILAGAGLSSDGEAAWGLFWLVLGVAVEVLVIRAFVRRHRRRKAVPSRF
jgi:hypothetical protein